MSINYQLIVLIVVMLKSEIKSVSILDFANVYDIHSTFIWSESIFIIFQTMNIGIGQFSSTRVFSLIAIFR